MEAPFRPSDLQTLNQMGEQMSKKVQMPQAVEAFIAATNAHNTDEFLATLTDNAVITDEGQTYSGMALST